MVRPSLVALLVSCLAASPHAATLYVANNGVDGPSCGPKKSPCRSISQAVNTIAADGDAVVVGPGHYGDLNENGIIADSPGEESGGFGCVLLLIRDVTLTSSDGAAATVIDGHVATVGCNVGILADGTQFGKPGKGFTVTNTQNANSNGILVDAMTVTVSGNQVVTDTFEGFGIATVDNPDRVLIESNQVIGWATGIDALGAGKTVRKNQLSRNGDGIDTNAATVISGNVIVDSSGAGISLSGAGSASVVGNAILGNFAGLFLAAPFSGTIEKNDFFGSRRCGLLNGDPHHPGVAGAPATNNYWGAATGPGPAPADDAGSGAGCDLNGGTTDVAPFATKPFRVKAPIKP